MTVLYVSMPGHRYMAFVNSSNLAVRRLVCGARPVEFVKKNLQRPISISPGAVALRIEVAGTAFAELLRLISGPDIQYLSFGKRKPERYLSMASVAARARSGCASAAPG